MGLILENNNHEYGLFYGSVGAHFPISKSVSPNFPIKLTHKNVKDLLYMSEQQSYRVTVI